MPVGIIAHQVAMVEPYHLLGEEESLEQTVDVLPGKRLVSVGCQQALRGGEDGTLSVALDASALKYESLVVLHRRIKGTLVVELQVDGVVLLPGEFLAPSVKLEVEQMDRDDMRVASASRYHADRSVVARPCIIGVHLVEVYAVHLALREPFGEHSACTLHDGCNHKQLLVAGDDVGKFQISVGYLPEIGFPVCTTMWPGQHNGALRLPFCRKCEIAR